MTVGELRNRLSKIPDNAHVVVFRELRNDHECFEIDSVDLKTGTPSPEHGKLRFAFDRTGPATWCFIEISND
jgi:hypothetical protein